VARGINKVILVGNLGNDPEVRYMPSGSAVANITVATTRSWKDKQTGQQQEETEWHRVSFFGRLAEVVGEYLKKGSQVYIEGRLRTRKWQDKTTGADRYTTEIVANEMQMLGGRAGGSAEYNQAPMSSSRPPQQQQQQQQQAAPQQQRPMQQPQQQQSGYVPPAGGMDGDFDDDIPF